MEENKIILPAIAIRGLVPIPHVDFRIEVGREISILALEQAEKMYGGNVILIIQKDPNLIDINVDNIYEVGVMAKIQLKLKMPNGNYKVKFKITDRVKIVNYESLDPYIVIAYEKLKSVVLGNEEELALIRKVIETFQRDGKNYLIAPDEVSRLLQQGLTTEETADVMAYYLKTNDKYKYLAELNVAKRLEYLLEDAAKERKIIEIENKINEDVKKSIDESQKEYYLREKMRAIQTELGDKARQDEEVDELRKKILAAKMPQKIEEKALKELERYSNTNNQMAESGIIRSYLDFLIALPWYKTTEDTSNLKEVEKALDKNHYGLTKVKERIVEYLAVKMMTGKNPSTILCFAGPPGVGKTSLAKSISEALGRNFIKQSLGGVRDESEIRGHRRTYVGALPGRILKGMKDAGTINPVFLLDEIDKMASDYRGDPAAAMLEVLDPEQNSNFSDNYLEEPYDLSQVMFITTANSLEDIPGPLRDRMEIIELSSYTEYEKFNIAFKHLLPKELKNHGLTDKQLQISESAMLKIIQGYTREAGVRELDRLISTICRKAVKDILIDHKEKIEVTEDNLLNYLGKIRFFNNEGRNENQIGVVTGLAYTQFGGDTLDIEVMTYPGKGGLILTGKLGDVMKESAQAGLSYVKSHAKDLGIEVDFANIDIHIHVPEGAVPKDGPSAGVTLITALVSALANKPVPANIGMTGEITLRGSVLPIGGLREKSIAAVRTGLKTIFIPKENERDLDEVPDEVKEKLQIIPVKSVSELLSKIF